MGRKKILKLLSEIFALGQPEKQQKIDELTSLLDNLKIKEKKLIEKVSKEQDANEVISLNKKIDIVHTYRKKGLNMLKELKHEGSTDTSN